MSEAHRQTSRLVARSTVRIGELAVRAGTTPDTIRYYERLGLLGRAHRTPAGYRVFPDSAVKRLRVIRNAQQFGFSLAQIRQFLQVRDVGHAPCRTVRDAAQERLAEVEAKIRELMVLRDTMRSTLAVWSKRLEDTPQGHAARLLEDLPETGHRRSHRLHRR
jgi:MerR family Zn(II)-responsive transcriptional regulator of zntA